MRVRFGAAVVEVSEKGTVGRVEGLAAAGVAALMGRTKPTKGVPVRPVLFMFWSLADECNAKSNDRKRQSRKHH
jgi:hypothetical protein